MSIAMLSDSWRVWTYSRYFQIHFREATDIHYNLPKAFFFGWYLCITFMLPYATFYFPISTFFGKETPTASALSRSSNACTTRDDILPRCSFHGGFILALEAVCHTWQCSAGNPLDTTPLMGPFPAQKETKPIKLIKPSTVYIYINK